MEGLDGLTDVGPVSPRGRIGVVGAGDFGRFCIRAYRQCADLEVLGVADASESALRAVDTAGARLVRDPFELLADERIEVIHVATPPFVREGLVEAALAAGKSVFCEKPLALSLPEADAMIAAADAAGLALGVDYVMRHHPAYDLLDRLARSGLFGSLRTIAFQNFAQAVPAGHWFWDRAKSGGILVEHGVHFFDAYGRIAGSASQVWGASHRAGAISAGVRYESGAIGSYYHEFAYPREAEYAEGVAAFERGVVRIAGWIPTEFHARVLASPQEIGDIVAGIIPGIAIQGGDATSFDASFSDRGARYAAAIVAGIRDVVIRHRDPSHRMKVTAGDARASLALALRAEDLAEAR